MFIHILIQWNALSLSMNFSRKKNSKNEIQSICWKLNEENPLKTIVFMNCMEMFILLDLHWSEENQISISMEFIRRKLLWNSTLNAYHYNSNSILNRGINRYFIFHWLILYTQFKSLACENAFHAENAILMVFKTVQKRY